MTEGTAGKPMLLDGYRDLIGDRALVTLSINGFDQVVIGPAIAHTAVGITSGRDGSDRLVAAARRAAIEVVAGYDKRWLGRWIPLEQDAVRLLVGRDPDQNHAYDSAQQDCQDGDRYE